MTVTDVLIVVVSSLLLLCGFCLSAQTSDALVQERMRQLHDLTQWGENQRSGDASQQHAPLVGGPDDDPTLAADVVQHEPSPAAKKLAVHAEKLSRKKQHLAAIADLQHALQLDPAYYEAANNLALEYFASGKSAQAIDTLKHIIGSEPQYVVAFDNLAIVLCLLGRYPDAEIVARRAYAAHPFSYKAAYVFGSSLVHQGKWTPEARQALRYASERHPEASQILAEWPQQGKSPAQ